MLAAAPARHVVPLLCALAALPPPAGARPLEAIRRSGELRCGGAIRPGLAVPVSAAGWRGLEPDICRAIARALLGSAGRMRFQSHGLPADLSPPGAAEDVAFLAGSELPAPPSPAAVQVTAIAYAIAVRPDASARHLADLGPALVCAEPGTDAERALGPYLRAHAPAAALFMFQEDVERLDAFTGGRCDAIAGEAATLAAWGTAMPMRLLPEPYATTPLYAVTDPADADWSATVAPMVGDVLQHPPPQEPMP